MHYNVYLFVVSHEAYWAGVAHSIQPLATGWTVLGSNFRGGEIFCTRSDRLSGPPILPYKW